MAQEYHFPVRGMHCNACEIFIEDEVSGLEGVRRVHVSRAKEMVTVEVEGASREELAERIAARIMPHGYSLSLTPPGSSLRQYDEYWTAVPLALGIFGIFLWLQKLGIVNRIGAGEVSVGGAFFIGIVASLSTCMAIVGGIVLTLSSRFAKEGSTIRPHALFHIGRIVSFVVFGGVVGLVGSMVRFGRAGVFVMSSIVALVMIMLGLDLLEFRWARRLKLTLPSGISKYFLKMKTWEHGLVPFFIGMVTFVLPCGFTQSMQLYALSTGSFREGAMIMGAFVAGTFPILALISFTSFSFRNSKYAGVFFKTAGSVIILFAIFNLLTSATAMGWIDPIFQV